jgi:hypothetical protein
VSRALAAEAKAAIAAAHPLWFAAHHLRLLHKIHQPRIDIMRRRRAAIEQLRARIAACAEGGQILVIESGRDCDGVEYSGHTRIIDATLAAFRKLDAEIGEWADGPYSLDVDRPSIRGSIEPESRDLVLEAMEDGHRHVIYSRFP